MSYYPPGLNRMFKLIIDPTLHFEHAWAQLEALGLEILFGSQEEDHIEIVANIPDKAKLPSWVVSVETYSLPKIDWEKQWAEHGHNYRDGYVNLTLSEGQEKFLRLIPGPGFGDMSHPTTQLMIDMLSDDLTLEVQGDKVVLDIGCGSGILTLTAIALGATYAYGIDIDPQAIEHSLKNAALNFYTNQCEFFLPENLNFSKGLPHLILINMIQAEQQAAWESVQEKISTPYEVITSGILKDDREIYLSLIKRWGWSLKKEKEKNGWLSFHFTLN